MANSIDDLKATLSKKGGLAKQDRFNVFFTPPQSNILRNPLQAITNIVSSSGDISNVFQDPRDVSVLCESVSIPGRNISTFDHGDVGQMLKYPYTFIDGEVTMIFHLTNDYAMKHMFDSWMEMVLDTNNHRAVYKDDYVADIIVQQLDGNNVPIYSVKLINAFPTAVDGIILDNKSIDTTQRMTVTLAYDKYVEEGLIETITSTASTLTNFTGLFNNGIT